MVFGLKYACPQIIGQGGPSNEIFAELWSNIANYWKDESRVIFGL